MSFTKVFDKLYWKNRSLYRLSNSRNTTSKRDCSNPCNNNLHVIDLPGLKICSYAEHALTYRMIRKYYKSSKKYVVTDYRYRKKTSWLIDWLIDYLVRYDCLIDWMYRVFRRVGIILAIFRRDFNSGNYARFTYI